MALIPSTGPQEVFSQDGVVNANGTYTFENIEMPLNRIFLAEIVVDGITMQSQYAIAKEGVTRSLFLHSPCME